MSLKTVLKVVKKKLVQKEKIQEKAREKMRKTTSLSKLAILRVHQKKIQEGKKLIDEATVAISRLQDFAKEHPEIIYSGMFSAALQEYAEANIFLRLIEESRFVSIKEVNVPACDYVLGLADTIGECRRVTLDALREGKVAEGEKFLEIIDEMYVELMALDDALVLVPGLRRKCDVARKIVEITRGDLTQEVRRKAMRDYLKSFRKTCVENPEAAKGLD